MNEQTLAAAKSYLAETVSFLDAPQNAAAPNGLLAVQATSSLLDALADLAKVLGAQVKEYLPLLKPYVMTLYETKIKPLDIKFVPDAIEPVIDDLIGQMLEKGIDAIIAAQETVDVSKAHATARLNDVRDSLTA